MSGGITHPPQILCSLVVLGFAADLMRGEGFVVANFSVHPKEEERCTTEEEINEGTPPLHCSVERKDNRCLRAPPYLQPVSRRATSSRGADGEKQPRVWVTFVTQSFAVLLSKHRDFPFISWFQSRPEMFLAQSKEDETRREEERRGMKMRLWSEEGRRGSSRSAGHTRGY